MSPIAVGAPFAAEAEGIDARSTNHIEQQVSLYFNDIPVMKDIAWCESRNRHYTSSGNILRGEVNPRDVGVMQINLDAHEETAEKLGFDVFTLRGNMAYARYLYDTQGTRPWKYSQRCWENIEHIRG